MDDMNVDGVVAQGKRKTDRQCDGDHRAPHGLLHGRDAWQQDIQAFIDLADMNLHILLAERRYIAYPCLPRSLSTSVFAGDDAYNVPGFNMQPRTSDPSPSSWPIIRMSRGRYVRYQTNWSISHR
jgi:hypothetical protein